MIMESIKIQCLELGPLLTNCYIAGDTKTGEALVIDPAGDADTIFLTAGRMNLKISTIVLTHAHVDHISGVKELKEITGANFMLHKKEALLLKSAPLQAVFFGIKPFLAPTPDSFLDEGDNLKVGNMTFNIYHIPGHSPGSICLHFNGVVFSGDVIFYDSIGRTDLPGGNFEELISGINKKLMTLPDNTIIYPGHGPSTTVGREKKYNPFLNI